MRKHLAFVGSLVALLGLTAALTDKPAWSQANPIRIILS